MTPDQVKAIQESFSKVAPISEQAAELFYGRLFEIAPAVKPLFHGDMKEQGRKLMGTLASRRQRTEQSGKRAARRERACQASCRLWRQAGRLRPRRRGAVVDAGKGLGDGLDAGLAAAWGAAYTTLSEFMIGEAYGRSAAAE